MYKKIVLLAIFISSCAFNTQLQKTTSELFYHYEESCNCFVKGSDLGLLSMNVTFKETMKNSKIIVEGKVVDTQEDKPMPSVSIFHVEQKGDVYVVIGKLGTTDEDGTYSVKISNQKKII